MENIIKFPSMGLEFYIEKVAFKIFGRPVMWYGIIIAAGFLLALIFAISEAKRKNINQDKFLDMIFWTTPIAIIGARAYYVVFDPYPMYESFIDYIAIWNGGIAIYGAIIFGGLTVLIFCKIQKINVLEMFDIVAPSVMIGQIIGRWGNFVNKEAYGGETECFFRMQIYDGGSFISVQPTFLYESVWNLIGFLIIFFYRKKQKFDGELFSYYLIWYGIGRVAIEAMRSDSLMLGDIKVSVLVAILSILLGSAIYFKGRLTKTL